MTAPQDGLLWRVTPDATRSIDVGAGARGVAVAGGSVWVANAARGTVTRIDPRSNRVTRCVRVGNAPRALASDGGRLWVTVAAGGGGAPASDAARAASGAVTAPACGGVIAGAGTPQRLIVSDLPLHREGIGADPGRDRVRPAPARVPRRPLQRRLPVVRRLDRQAGRLRAGEVQGECRPVRAHAARRRDRRAVQLRLRARAARDDEPRPAARWRRSRRPTRWRADEPGAGRGAGSSRGSTRPDAATTPASWAPTTARAPRSRSSPATRGSGGWRSCTTTTTTDGRSAARRAGGAPARGRRRRPVPRRPQAGRRARAGARASHRARPARTRCSTPASRSGPLQKEKPGFALVREVARRLGNDMPVLGPDSWADGPAVFEALGRWARNIHLSVPGVPLERLGPAGRRFVAEFRETQPGGLVTSDAVYFAQATELLLAAIARSDGSRSSVTESCSRPTSRTGSSATSASTPTATSGRGRTRSPASRLAPAPSTASPVADLEAIISPP